MLDSSHTSVPMLMRGNALVLKTPVENAPRTNVEKHLSWSSDWSPPKGLNKPNYHNDNGAEMAFFPCTADDERNSFSFYF